MKAKIIEIAKTTVIIAEVVVALIGLNQAKVNPDKLDAIIINNSQNITIQQNIYYIQK